MLISWRIFNVEPEIRQVNYWVINSLKKLSIIQIYFQSTLGDIVNVSETRRSLTIEFHYVNAIKFKRKLIVLQLRLHTVSIKVISKEVL